MSGFLLPVDASLVLQFARAVDDPTLLANDPRFAERAQAGEVVPPPTFLVAKDHFDPHCRRRPAPGEAWPGSGLITPDWSPIDTGRGRGLHAQQSFEYHRHPRVGEMLTVTSQLGEAWAKRGRQGLLLFTPTVTEYRAQDGEPVATTRWVGVSVLPKDAELPAGVAIDSGPTSAATAAPEPVSARVIEGPTPVPQSRPAAAEIRPGQSWSAQLADPLTLSHIVRYAGASGDFIGVHHDPEIARIVSGYRYAFAHGMLTMGLTGSVLTALFGTENLECYTGRMLAVVYPGDSLTATVTVRSTEPREADEISVADLQLTTHTQHGDVAFAGTARARLTDRTPHHR